MEFSYVYETGARAYNEDALLYRSSLFAEGELVLAAVCDGMGGMQSGMEASLYCVKEMEEWFDTQIIPCVETYGMKHGKLKRIIRSKGYMLYQHINRKLFDRMRVEKVRLGTTATMCLIFGEYYYLFHLGDSRCYCFSKCMRQTKIRQLTKDHGATGGLYKCLGLNKEWKPEFLMGKLGKQSLLLCSDGFWRKQDLQLWKRCLNCGKMKDEKGIVKRLKTVADYNLRMGEKDNLSAIYIRR